MQSMNLHIPALTGDNTEIILLSGGGIVTGVTLTITGVAMRLLLLTLTGMVSSGSADL